MFEGAETRKPTRPTSGPVPTMPSSIARPTISIVLLALLAACAPDADTPTPESAEIETILATDDIDRDALPETRTFDGPTAEELDIAGPVEGPATRIRAERILSDVAILSADSMAGRAPGTEGEERAVRHIERRFSEIGLEPVGDPDAEGAGAGYRLPIELVGMTKDLESSWVTLEGPAGPEPDAPVRPLDLVIEENFTFWSTAELPIVELREVPVIFVGHGVTAPEYDWDDFKVGHPDTPELEGAILLFLNDDPAVTEDGEALFGGDIRTYYGRWTYKFEQAEAQGALGAIVIHTDESAAYDFSVIGNMGERLVWQRDYRLPFLAWMDSTRTHEVARALDTDVPGLFEMGADRDFRPVDTGFRLSASIETDFERVRAPNVAGIVRGTDPDLADEYIVFTAHHDHMGIDPSLPGDTIFNGALDNALGVASIIAAAEAFAAAEPRRSVIFLSVTAEEGGLLGSGLFVEDPPVPLRSIIANFNVDSPQSYGLTRDVGAIGIDMNSLGEVFIDVAESYGLAAAGDPNPAAGSFYRSDQLNFAKAGIPALYLQRGRDFAEPLDFDPEARRLEHYHQPSDQITPEWDLKGVERDMRILFETALRVANADTQPRWVPGNEFEAAWEALYGGR